MAQHINLIAFNLGKLGLRLGQRILGRPELLVAGLVAGPDNALRSLRFQQPVVFGPDAALGIAEHAGSIGEPGGSIADDLQALIICGYLAG